MDPKPAITAPVMRFIGVADIARSVQFYRDVLGFEVRDVAGTIEVVYGPACLQFGKQDYAPCDWETPRPPGTAILFFETDDIAAMQAAIRARGGAPSELEKVNWIKMQVCEIRDPDGHTLWFGQSYNVEFPPRPPAMLHKAVPELPFDDVPAAVAYYRDVLGFHINYAQGDMGVMDRDEVTLVLIARTERHVGIGSTYVYIEDADKLYAELSVKGANLLGEPVSHPWGLRDFRANDLEGNRITFGQPFE